MKYFIGSFLLGTFLSSTAQASVDYNNFRYQESKGQVSQYKKVLDSGEFELVHKVDAGEKPSQFNHWWCETDPQSCPSLIKRQIADSEKHLRLFQDALDSETNPRVRARIEREIDKVNTILDGLIEKRELGTELVESYLRSPTPFGFSDASTEDAPYIKIIKVWATVFTKAVADAALKEQKHNQQNACRKRIWGQYDQCKYGCERAAHSCGSGCKSVQCVNSCYDTAWSCQENCVERRTKALDACYY